MDRLVPHPARPRTLTLVLSALPAILTVAAFAAFAQTFAFPFVRYDDQGYVFENPWVLQGLTWEGAKWAFTTFAMWNWHPLTWLSYMLEVTIWGPNPAAMHLMNAALHAGSSGLLALVLGRMTGAPWKSAAVAALFALHPTRVESVVWVAERKDVLSVFFAAVALLAYHAYASRPSAARYGLVTLAFTASIASKAMTVTLPFLLLLLDAWPLRRVQPWASSAPQAPKFPLVSWRRALIEKAPLLLTAALCTVLNVRAQDESRGIIDAPLFERLASAAVGYVRYLGLLVWPHDLALHYPMPDGGYAGWQVAASVTAIVCATIVALRLALRVPWVTLGWLWFVGTLIPVIGVVKVGTQAVAVRYTYWPAVGLFIVLVWAAADLTRGRARQVVAFGFALVLALCTTSTVAQAARWRDPVELFEHTIAVTGPNGRAHLLLAAALRDRDDLAASLHHARIATSIDESDVRFWTFRGEVARELGAHEEAESAFRRSIAIDESYERAWFKLAELQQGAGRPHEALRTYSALVERTNSAKGWNDLGVLLARLGNSGEALAALRSAVGADPGDAALWQNLGAFHAQRENWREAAQALERASVLQPRDLRLLRRLAFAQARAGDRAGAHRTVDRLGAVDPQAAAELRRALTWN